jgi:hypothetical protein
MYFTYILCINAIGTIEPIAGGVLAGTSGLAAMFGDIGCYYITFLGSRFLGDKQFAKFWGIKKGIAAWCVGVIIFGFIAYQNLKSMIVSNSTNSNNKQDVKDKLNSYADLWGYIGILTNIGLNYLVALFNSWNMFKEMMIGRVGGMLVVALPTMLIGYYSKDSWITVWVGANTMNQFAQLSLMLAIYFLYALPRELKREAEAMHEKMGDKKWLTLGQALGFDWDKARMGRGDDGVAYSSDPSKPIENPVQEKNPVDQV